MAKRKCQARFYVQSGWKRSMFRPVSKAQAKKIAGVRATETAHTQACAKGEGKARCKKSGDCKMIFAYKQ